MKATGKRKKGNRYELEIAKTLRDAGLDKKATRMVLSGGAFGFPGDINTSLPIHIEAKRQEKIRHHKAYAQAVKDCPTTKIPVVVTRRSHEPSYVWLSWNDFLYILKYAIDGGMGERLPFAK